MATILICDICGNGKRDNVKTVHFPYGTSPDPSGNGHETDSKAYDLCYNHHLIILENVICKFIKNMSLGGSYITAASVNDCANRFYFNYMCIEEINRLINLKK